MRKFLIFFILTLFICLNVYASVFDNMIPSTRAAGMGGAFISVSNDTTAIFYNPAGTADIDRLQLYFGYKELYGMDDLAYNVFSMSKGIGKYGTVSVGYQGFIVKYLDEKIESEDTYTLTHSLKFYDQRNGSLFFGYSLNWYTLFFRGYGLDTALGLDAGLFAILRKKVKAGFAVKNFNVPTLGTEFPKEIPHRLTMGISYQPYYGVITLAEVEKKEGETGRIHAGTEFELSKFFKLRLGISTDPNVLSGGFNITVFRVGVDYTYLQHPVLEGTHQFGLYLKF